MVEKNVSPHIQVATVVATIVEVLKLPSPMAYSLIFLIPLLDFRPNIIFRIKKSNQNTY